MKETNKIATYIGFAIRSGNYKIGGNSIATLKGANLVIVCSTASENTVKLAKKYSTRFGCKLLTTKTPTLAQLTFKENAKLMAITDSQLAKAIIDNIDQDFISEV